MIPWQKYAGDSDLFMVDYSAKLELGGQIMGATVTADSGVVVSEETIYPTAVKFRLSGGTSGAQATVTCTATTAIGDTLIAEPLLDIL